MEGRSPWYLAWRRLRRNKTALGFGVLFLVIVAACVAALSERRPGADVSPSWGAVLLPEEADSPEGALSLADERMYGRKGNGRRRGEPAMGAHAPAADSVVRHSGSRAGSLLFFHHLCARMSACQHQG